MINPSLAVLIVVIVSYLGLGLIVYLNNPRSKTNRLYVLLILSIIIWVISNFFENELITRNFFEVLLKIDFISAVIMAYLWLMFVLNFPRKNDKIPLLSELLLLMPGLLFVLLILANQVITNVRFNNSVIFDPGPLFWFYAAYNFLYFIGGCFILIYNYYKTSGIEKIQTYYVVLGAFITAAIALFMNLIIPQIVQNVPIDVSRAGIYSFLFLASFTTFAIVKHRMFDIRVILTETATAIVVLALFIQTLLSKSLSAGVINGGILILTTYGGYVLIKSVQEEIRRREELKRLSDQLTIANVHLKELDAMKTEFVSLASHELLTPVSAIEGYLSMLLDEKMAKIEDPKAQKYMDRVYTSAKRLARLVTDMLNVSRIEEGRLLVQKRDLNLVELIEQVIDEIKFKAEEKKQKIIFGEQPTANSLQHDTERDSEDKKPSAVSRQPSAVSRQPSASFMTFGDPDKIKEVVINLLGNSIKYSKNPGMISVHIEKIPTEWVKEKWQKVENEIKERPLDDQEAIKSAADPHLRDLVGPQQLLISVQDQGIGIPKEELPRLFKKFHRVGDYTTAESQGTGLGLYISRALVELHHGRIWADSEGHDKGSTFTFSLPDISSKDELLKMEAQAPKQKEALKPLARPVREAEEL